MPHPDHSAPLVIIGAGPAGLMAAEVLACAGESVVLLDAMPSVGRKFLLAGIGGLNISHSEPLAPFISRYAERAPIIAQWLEQFSPDDLRQWVHGLGIETFVGSSRRVFPKEMKAAPLLRAWLRRLRGLGVHIHTRSRWLGWDEQGLLRIQTPHGERQQKARATLLALGGGSWPKLGSDGAWLELLTARGVACAPLAPSNCGFVCQGWSAHLKEHFAGAPIKPVAAYLPGHSPRQGEFILTQEGLEGSLIYALSADIRRQIEQSGSACLYLDLQPNRSVEQIEQLLAKARPGQSLGTLLRRQLGLDAARCALVHELADKQQPLAAQLKALPVTLIRPQPLAEAISSAGGVEFAGLDAGLMLRALPGVFCAGEMLDWEAPTGGYLLTACLASGKVAAHGILKWLKRQ